MDDARRQHLELVAAGLTQAYYREHTSPNRDYRDLLDTYTYILDALVEKDSTRASATRRSEPVMSCRQSYELAGTGAPSG